MSAQVRFARPTDARALLDRRVRERLAALGRPERGGARIVAKTIFVLALLAASYVALVFEAGTTWQAIAAAFVVSQAIVMVGFCVMHDAGHGSYSSSARVNLVVGHALDLIGGSQTLWRIKHGHFHHSYTNLAGHDDDLESGGLLRLHPEQPRRSVHRHQAVYALPLYSLLALHWVVSDFGEFFGARIGRHEIRKPTRRETFVFLGFKALFLSLALVVPMTRHAPWRVLAFFVGIELVVGFCLTLVFQLAHVVDGVAMPTPSLGGHIEDEWVVHQLRTTANFATRNPLVTFYTGGLNHQIEHHLFPKISHVHYAAIRDTVEATCRELGLPYVEHETVRGSVRAHLQRLRALGTGDDRGRSAPHGADVSW